MQYKLQNLCHIQGCIWRSDTLYRQHIFSAAKERILLRCLFRHIHRPHHCRHIHIIVIQHRKGRAAAKNPQRAVINILIHLFIITQADLRIKMFPAHFQYIHHQHGKFVRALFMLAPHAADNHPRIPSALGFDDCEKIIQQTHCLIVCNPSGLQIFPVKFPQIIVNSSDLYCPRRKHIEALQLNCLLHALRWCSLNVFQTLCHLQKFLLSHPVIFLSSQTLCLRCILPHYPAKGFLHRSYALVKILFLRLLRFLRQSECFITQTANAKPEQLFKIKIYASQPVKRMNCRVIMRIIVTAHRTCPAFGELLPDFCICIFCFPELDHLFCLHTVLPGIGGVCLHPFQFLLAVYHIYTITGLVDAVAFHTLCKHHIRTADPSGNQILRLNRHKVRRHLCFHAAALPHRFRLPDIFPIDFCKFQFPL